ncbi:14910_t:CDS:2 [Dentiscutata heterogama]|uniref:14910_t:CDS:1 n=1 Tax=Dentiscutata heterogama TaxID=1316150 RepID=A0ACA9LDL7_9GLOM|nr:14910_t:CDS:2 [Dentiscutata heterogama]
MRDVCDQMKLRNIKPDVNTYNILLSAYQSDGDVLESFKLLDDLLLAGIKPNIDTYNALLKTVIMSPGNQPAHLRELIFDMIERDWLQPTIVTYDNYLTALLVNGEIERGIDFIDILKNKGIQPTVTMYENLMKKICHFEWPEEALSLLKRMEAENLPTYSSMYYDVLRCSTDQYYLDGLIYCWEKIIEERYLDLDEGACIDVLHVAARFGKPHLAAQVLVYLTENRKVSLDKWHLEPLLEAFINDNDIKQAMDMLSVMTAAGVKPNSRTALPIVAAISKNVESIDKAYYSLEELVKDDIHRAVETYKSAEKLGVKPDVHTFNALLGVCFSAQHRELGQQFWTEMQRAGIQPDSESYRRMIYLCCGTDYDYEDAFVYLEEMKAQNILPSSTIYEKIIKTCINHNDSRAKLALEEMESFGYTIPKDIRNLFENNGVNRTGSNRGVGNVNDLQHKTVASRDFNFDFRSGMNDQFSKSKTDDETSLESDTFNAENELNDLDSFLSALTKMKIKK